MHNESNTRYLGSVRAVYMTCFTHINIDEIEPSRILRKRLSVLSL